MNQQKIGGFLKKLRLEKQMTQEQLASLLGVSAQAVSKWETSETYPDGALLVPIANALDVSLDVLLIIIFDNRIKAEVSAENDAWMAGSGHNVVVGVFEVHKGEIPNPERVVVPHCVLCILDYLIGF